MQKKGEGAMQRSGGRNRWRKHLQNSKTHKTRHAKKLGAHSAAVRKNYKWLDEGYEVNMKLTSKSCSPPLSSPPLLPCSPPSRPFALLSRTFRLSPLSRPPLQPAFKKHRAFSEVFDHFFQDFKNNYLANSCKHN